jgi:DNA-directed RNA polymerase specialized sigma24 family protein
MMRRISNDRCTSNDYRRLFAGSAERLRWLCYMLTSSEELSEKLLNAALEQSLKGSDHVFREWMISWARRLIIRVCIDTMRPQVAGISRSAYLLPPMRLDAIDPERLSDVLSLPAEVFQERLLQMDVLSRFVFVLRGLEGYSRRETSLLLNIDDRACEWIYVRAAEAMEADAEFTQTSPAVGAAHSTEYFLAQVGQ